MIDPITSRSSADHSTSGIDEHTERMMQMIYGFAVSQVVRAFAEFSIADELARGPKKAAEIAMQCNANEEAMFRLLRAGIPLGLVTADREFTFSSTPLLRTLEEGAPRSVRGLARLLSGRGTWQTWGNLPEAVRTGKEQSTSALGKNYWEYMEQAPAEHAIFIRAMTDISDSVGSQLAKVIDTQSVSVAADIGGGSGELIRPMLMENRNLRGVVFDVPASVEKSTRQPIDEALRGRLSFVAGDFFQSVPEHADLYLLKHILHDWDDDACVSILKNCAKAMHTTSRIAVIEMVIEKENNVPRTLLQDLNMFVHFGSRERTVEDFERIFAAADLRLAGTAHVQSPLGPTTVMEVVKT